MAESGDRNARTAQLSPAQMSRAGAQLLTLMRELHGAAQEAAADGYERMAQLLDECGVEVARAVESGHPRSTDRTAERGVRCLAAWLALRGW
ncbi:MAG: hypothetical protein JWM53_723 [bacterium]|nr:hypothetical protein [bacterium]